MDVVGFHRCSAPCTVSMDFSPRLLLHLLVLAPASSSSEAEQTESSAWNRAGPSSCCSLALRFATGSCDH